MRTRLHFPYLLLVCCLFVFGCGSHDESKLSNDAQDSPLEPYQAELLDIAFQTATAIPMHPHIKDRSRAQESVVETCLELKQPQRALEYIEQIKNWRRGAGYADLALFYAQHGAMKEKIDPYLTKAAKIAEENEDWRRDRIRVKIAQSYILLGQYKQAQVFAAGVVDSEAGKVSRAEATTFSADLFDKKIEALEKVVSSGNFDVVKNTLEAYTELFNRFYKDVERRSLIEDKIRGALKGLPLFIQIDLLMELAAFALDHKDQDKAFHLVDEAKTLMDSAKWEVRFAIPLKAKLAGLCFRAGNEQNAHMQVQEILNLFDTEREQIVNIYRAEMLRSIAEAYWTMRDGEMAMKLYKRTVEAGIENPNSRPRAEDLTATCCSMALNRFKPNEELLSRIHQVHDGLGDPW